jgi:hypothetical protein
MNVNENDDRFKIAKQHIANNEFEDALSILNNLSTASPNDEDILFSMARCMGQLDRVVEAKAMCEHLVQQFDHAGAKDLLEQLKPKPIPPPVDGKLPHDSRYDTAYELLPEGTSTPFVITPQQALPYVIWAGLFLIAYIQYLVVSLIFDQDSLLESMRSGEPATGDEIFAALMLVEANLAFAFALLVLVSFLNIMGHTVFLHNRGYKNIADAALYTVFCIPLLLIPFIGWTIAWFLLIGHYKLGYRQAAFMVVTWFGLVFCLSFFFDILLLVLRAI